MVGILDTVKKMIGLDSEYTVFDVDLLVFINSAFASLEQLGAGPEGGFRATSASVWTDYDEDENVMPLIQDYVFLKTRHMFDPPSSSFVNAAIENEIKEIEWRINVFTDKGEEVS